MNSKEWAVVHELVSKQLFGVLGTSRGGHAYTSLVAYAVKDDISAIFFATTRATRKYHNLSEDNRVALLVDNRSEQSMPLYEAAAVTIYGAAAELGLDKREEALETYLGQHPQLKAFVSSPTTALFRMDVEEVHLVQRFQNVTEFRINK